AEEVGDIDRTSPNKIKKTQFAGVWYYIQTMVDVPQQSAQGFIGNTNFGNAAKVVFELTEGWLYVLPVTETVQFSEKPYQLKKIRNFWDAGKSNEFVEMYVGQPIAAFPLTHFDVIRDYNPSTGKQGNTLSENTTDRVWHEREYVRVNWGGNMILDWAFPAGSSQFSAVDHYVQEAEDPYLRPEGAGENPDLPEFEDGYIAFVTKAFAPPSSANWQGYICDPYGVSNTDCAGSVLKLRHSFKRADATPDVETLVYTNGEHMDKFGFFLAERHAYDPLWDMTESARDYKGQRWNLWQKTWKNEDLKDAAGNAIACNDHADCGADDKVLDYQANRCVKETIYKPGTCQKSTLMKLADRGLNPIIYHLSAALPPEGDRNSMLRQFYKSADEWSRAFKDALAWGLLLEEKGQYWTQACETNADCTKGRSDVLVDTTIDMPRTVVDSKTWITCSAAEPCDKNQLCKTDSDNKDKCFDAAGQLVFDESLVAGTRRAVMVIYQGEGVNVIPVKEDQKLTGNKPSVRFVNVSGGTQSLTADGQNVATHETKAGEWVSDVTQLDAKSTVLTVGGASQTVTLANSFDYLVVYTGDSLIVSGTARAAAEGVRFIHTIQNKVVDVGVNAIRAAEGLRYEGVTTYAPQDFDAARITVTEAGAQGDLTCYFTGHEGRCTGWSAGWTEADDERLATLKSTVPDMFILCENQYDLGDEAANMKAAADVGDTYGGRGADWAMDAKSLQDGRYSVKGKNPYNWGGKQDLADPTAIFNPCKDLVPHPTELKKIGDM
ncbi:MAG: hypothetical protein IV100_04945, partial [Myxococcales bacterium]|nr:hypothetical protein [Myxococcales bacterium]